MIQELKVRNYRGEEIKMELTKPEVTGFAITDIDGIGPEKADILSSEIATTDGSLFNSSRIPKRTITINITFLPSPTIEDTRQRTYKYFPLKKPLTLFFKTDNRECYINGYVESNEPDIFSKAESTKISIVCPDPYFYSVREYQTIFYGIQPLFEFIFSNESLTRPLLEMGQINRMTEQTVYYEGDAEVGVVIHLIAMGEATDITIYNTETREKMRIDTDKLKKISGAKFGAGDELIITTIKGKKSVRLLRAGIYSNVLNCLDRDSDWFQLAKGDNVFTYTAKTGDTNLQFRVENQLVYEGI